MSFRTSRGISLRYNDQPRRGITAKPRVLTLGIVVFKLFGDARYAFAKEQHRIVASQREVMAKSYLHVLSCLDTRKNQRKSRLKSPTRWVPRGWNCHAILFATPAAWLMWYRLLDPPQRSTPDPLPGQAFMPLLASSTPFPLRDKGKGEVVFHIQPR